MPDCRSPAASRRGYQYAFSVRWAAIGGPEATCWHEPVCNIWGSEVSGSHVLLLSVPWIETKVAAVLPIPVA